MTSSKGTVWFVTLVLAQSCSQSQEWLFLPSSLQWHFVLHYVGSHCVISRTWCHQQRHCITKTSESCPKPNEIDGTTVFSILEHTSKSYTTQETHKSVPKGKEEKGQDSIALRRHIVKKYLEFVVMYLSRSEKLGKKLCPEMHRGKEVLTNTHVVRATDVCL